MWTSQSECDTFPVLIMKKFILLLILFSSYLKLYRSMEIWKDRNLNFLDYDDSINGPDEKCGENDICQNGYEEMFKKKPKEYKLPFSTNLNGKKSTRMASYFHPSRPMPCSCGIEFRLMDLGHQYYPRYLHTGVCKSDVCGGLYRCIEKHYKVRVLKQKDTNAIPEIKNTLSLAENIKSIWQPESITVTVACECSL